jgi:hypothetical protein
MHHLNNPTEADRQSQRPDHPECALQIASYRLPILTSTPPGDK